MDKPEWEKKLQDMGLPVTLERNVLMCKTSEKEVAVKFKKAIEEYPYSWGIKRLQVEGSQEDFISDDKEQDDE